MNLMDLGKQISKYAPLLGSVVGGPAGASIGQIVASQFGGNIDDPQDLLNKINQDPESHIKLCQIQASKQVDLERLAVQQAENELKYSLNNTANARATNLESQSFLPQVVSLLVVMGFFGCIYWVAAYEQQYSDHEVLYMMLGIVGTSFGAVVNYWLGSSMDKRK